MLGDQKPSVLLMRKVMVCQPRDSALVENCAAVESGPSRDDSHQKALMAAETLVSGVPLPVKVTASPRLTTQSPAPGQGMTGSSVAVGKSPIATSVETSAPQRPSLSCTFRKMVW